MKNVCFYLLVIWALTSSANPLKTNDSIVPWEAIPNKAFKAYGLILKSHLNLPSTNSFTILHAKKRKVTFYEETWLFHFKINENQTTKNIKLLCRENDFLVQITPNTDWNGFFVQHPPKLTSERAIVDFFTMTTNNLVLLEDDLPQNQKEKLKGIIHGPRIMFQHKGTYTIQSFIKEKGEVNLALHKFHMATKTIVVQGKSSLFLKEKPSTAMVLFSKIPLLYSKMGWVEIGHIPSR